jgi:hypothetical protein
MRFEARLGARRRRLIVLEFIAARLGAISPAVIAIQIAAARSGQGGAFTATAAAATTATPAAA